MLIVDDKPFFRNVQIIREYVFKYRIAKACRSADILDPILRDINNNFSDLPDITNWLVQKVLGKQSVT